VTRDLWRISDWGNAYAETDLFNVSGVTGALDTLAKAGLFAS
jgi:hypothetical protein